MLFSSTRGQDKNLTFIEVMLNGLAKDGGLYVPNNIPRLKKKDFDRFRGLSYSDLAFEITKKFVICDEISEIDYKNIVKKTYSNEFDKNIISLNKLNSNEYILNLYHGPTLAFKDYALQLLGNLYDFVLKKKKIKLTVIGATSGDTGSAAIYGCSKSKRVQMFILFPKEKISVIQRKQMTTFNNPNVRCISVNGNFDDCQKLVKDFFKSNNKKKIYNLAAINSINWVRILGQIVYYFWSYFQVERQNSINYVVPTGNFGNVYAGFVSKVMGLPIDKLIVCSNKNDILTRFLSTGFMEKKKVFKSLSPSMDIQISSNFERLMFFYLKDGLKVANLFKKLEESGEFSVEKKILSLILKEFNGGKVTDNETLNAIKRLFNNFGIISDPHTAVGYSVGRKKLDESEKRIYLSTAHFSKFIDTVSKATSKKLKYPSKLKKILKKREEFLTIKNNIKDLQKIIKHESLFY